MVKIAVSSPPYAGTFNQGLGVAEAVGRLSKNGEVAGIRRVRGSDGWAVRLPFAARLLSPDVLISCSQTGERRARRLLGATGRRRPLWAQIEVPAGGELEPDLVFVSHHDWRPDFDGRPNYRRMHGVPHRIRRSVIAARRADARNKLAIADARAVVVLIGGPNEAFDYDEGIGGRLERLVEELGVDGTRIFASTSRRTPEKVRQSLSRSVSDRVSLWTGDGPNPYHDYLAAADALVVSEDSMTMTCEAVATGKPVFSFGLTHRPGSRLDKFVRFHSHLQNDLGATRPAVGMLAPFEPAPFDDTERAAAEIVNRLRERSPR